MKLDDDGRRTDGRSLSYSDYINVPAILESLRIPREVPRGIHAEAWPEWPEGWKPGAPWPRGERWSHDETLFITTHQAFEVWFRQMLHELDDVLHRALEIVGRHDATVPRVHLADRLSDAARPLRDRLGRYPRLAGLIAKSEWREHVFDTAAPASFGPEAAPLRLSWFEDEWSIWTDRVERARAMLDACVPFFEILLHMTPASFLEFRNRLIPASGFGSGQFREIELLLGLRERHLGKLDWSGAELASEFEKLSPRERDIVAASPAAAAESFARHCPDDLPRIRRRLAAPTLRDLVHALLGSEELCGPDGDRRWSVADDLATTNYAAIENSGNPLANGVGRTATAEVWAGMGGLLAHTEAVLAADLHRSPGPWSGAAGFLESCLRLDNGLLEWRTKHMRFVERVIGARPGTGGGGLPYLRRTVDPGQAPYLLRAFPCLWQSRTLLV